MVAARSIAVKDKNGKFWDFGENNGVTALYRG
jgi:hypothetical protein